MNSLEQENKELKSQIKALKAANSSKLKTISRLNSIGTSLISSENINQILKNILLSIKEFTNADGGTIYIAHGDKLTFKHVLNDTLNLEQDDEDNDDIWNYLEIKEENNNMVAVNCALNKQTINVDNLYQSTVFDFSGTEEFDKKTGYRSRTMLVVPMLLSDGTLIGVLQLINKIDIENENNVLSFTKDDEELAHSLASQASIVIDKYRQNMFIMEQSKLAAMGEMIDAVAHQWTQPLTSINANASSLEMYLESGIPIDNDTLRNVVNDTQKQVSHLLETLNEFRTFLKPNKQRQLVNVSELIETVFLLVKDDLIKNKISTTISGDKNICINVVANEFKHIFINLINNARDAFLEESAKHKNENNIYNREIVFNIKETKNYIVIEVCDNAGGIPEDVIGNIFKANFTTKEEGKGTGVGLYMSTKVTEKFNGTISVENIDSGAKFIIKLAK